MTAARLLRERLAAPGPVVAPGAFDPLVARLAEQAGFDAVYMGGSATSAAIYARPDLGLTTLTEMVACARNMASAVSVPVIADADTGYGSELNVQRCVAEYEHAGLAGLHLEDGGRSSKDVGGSAILSTEGMLERLHVALDARSDPDFMIVGRCNGLRSEGMEKTVARARAYAEAGADAIFVLGLGDPDETAAIARELAGIPLMYNMSLRGDASKMSVDALAELGFKIVIVPNLTVFGAVKALADLLAELKEHGSIAHLVDRVATPAQIEDVTGLTAARELQKRYRTVAEST